MITISESIIGDLRRQPEYGMGYQVAIVKLNSGGTEEGIILNGRVFVKETELTSIGNMMSRYNELLTEAQRSPLRVVQAGLAIRPPDTLRGVRMLCFANSARGLKVYNSASRGPAEDAVITPTSYGEVFKRFSAYVDDFRVTESKGLVAGTFATTAEDAENVRTGMEAIARYALKDKKPANKVFTITPPSGTSLKRGTVQPANDEPGGGVEVIFVNGSPSNTVSGPALIPER
jgi:glutamine amidotransferase-like uncharacterized protein